MGQCLDSRLADRSFRFGHERHVTESIAATAAECRQARQFDLTLAKWATEDYGDGMGGYLFFEGHVAEGVFVSFSAVSCMCVLSCFIFRNAGVQNSASEDP